jgi:hypothetical protein
MPIKRRNTSRMLIITDTHYDGLRATDGTDISTRAKHRDYMRRNDLTTADDFSETWKKAAEQRAKVFTGEHDKKDRRTAIERAMERHYGASRKG